MKIYRNLFNDIISPENLFSAWDKFKKGKRDRKDVQLFEWNLETNIFNLYRELSGKTYKHGLYHSFKISDPKPRNVQKAQVRDRIVHHALFQVINPLFEAGFVPASFSCRVGHGTHKGVQFLQNTIRKASKNGKVPCFALKCDIKKFFDTIDHDILLSILKKKVKDNSTICLLGEIISSFSSGYPILGKDRGVPIGNLTSQLFANVYLNELDQFLKQELKVGYYLRYTDDFLIISQDKRYLERMIPEIVSFLRVKLFLEIHKEKTKILKINQGIDFLGYVVFLRHKLVRTRTRKRIVRKFQGRIADCRRGFISKNSLSQSLHSYLGFFSHASSFNISENLKRQFFSFCDEWLC
ncbi:MAG: reverse transcriptase/maturase family protein [Candidatus Staskawiczbacteria bacterium]|jgi:retron-type reverse transcriptase